MKNNVYKIYRYEKKYLLGKVLANDIQEEIKHLMNQDENGTTGGQYLVRSLYFDSIYNKDYYDKMDGVENRKKIRIRIYSIKDIFGKLESKIKCGDLQTKKSIIISRYEIEELIKGNYEVLLDDASEERLHFYITLKNELYKPVTMVEYDRTAFFSSQYNTRVTFDRNVRFSETNYNLFSNNVAVKEAFIGKTILEVKYNEKLLPYISKQLSNYNLTQMAISKYCTCRPVMTGMILD